MLFGPVAFPSTTGLTPAGSSAGVIGFLSNHTGMNAPDAAPYDMKSEVLALIIAAGLAVVLYWRPVPDLPNPPARPQSGNEAPETVPAKPGTAKNGEQPEGEQ